ncbi:MAG: pyridoxal-dependent decarboxylase [Gemmatimonadota bacterium]|nr:pyridoxal-dependent decarboxylase [Gemmatimonadota bacterium]
MTDRSLPAIGPLGDLSPEEMRAQLHRMADWVADYRETLEQRPILSPSLAGEVTARLTASPPERAERLAQILDDLDAVIMPGIVHWGHPAFLGYFGSTSNGPALLGEIAAAALNVSAMTWRTSPAATELESVMLDWIRQMVGLPPSFTGVLYDTASVALVHALAAARELSGPEVRARGLAGRDDLPTQRVYASEQAHSSVRKAMVLLGLGEQNMVAIPTDSEFRLEIAALRDAIEEDLRVGRHPLAVVATVGTTSTASVDPVADVAALCREHGLWMHVDAAYGGALAILPEGRWALGGAELADSVSINPHKWMFVPLDFSALFVRRPELLRALFSLTPEYLRGDAMPRSDGDERTGAAVDYMDYGIQLGRRFRALKAWMVFRAFGRDGMVSRLREHLRLARTLADWVDADPLFILAAPVTMAVVCFRCAPPEWGADACDRLNESIVEAVNASGLAYLTHTRLLGCTVMRVGIGNVLTTERHLARLWSCVREEAERARVTGVASRGASL